jgi:MoaA/NifB/PqqE/SkfB family radical SAM enzyme
MSNLISVVPVTRRTSLATKPEAIFFDEQRHHFRSLEGIDIEKAAEGFSSPMSVILQVTRKCNFDCSFCSEIVRIDDPTLEELDIMRQHLQGVQRVFLSGGEPLIRKDFPEIAEMFAQDFIVGLPTNATAGRALAKKLVGKVAFVNIGLEGPRTITSRVRGDYDMIMKGVWAFREVGLPLSFSAVMYRSTIEGLPFLYQIADVFQAGKVKLIMPIRKGNGLYLKDEEFLSEQEYGDVFQQMIELRQRFGWVPSLRMTTWTPENEGYSILVYPNGQTYAWPVYDAEDKVLHLGNLKEETIQEIWQKYPFKRNHLTKYLGKSIRVAQ